MELSKNTCTAFLVLVSLTVLAVTHNFVSLDKLNVDVPGVSFELTSPNKLLLPALAIGLLFGLLLCHVTTYRDEIVRAYQYGYRFAPKLFELARSRVMEASGGAHRHPAVGNIHATLRRGSYDLGRWTRPDGTLSALVEFTPDRKTHTHAVIRGIAHAMRPRLWAPFYAPVLLAVSAVVSMT